MSGSQVTVVVGASGAGKSLYSDALPGPVVHFDDIHDYGSRETDYSALRPGIVVDGWRLDMDRNLDKFLAACGVAADEIEVHVVYASPLELFLAQRRKELAGCYVIAEDQRTLRSHAAAWSGRQVHIVRTYLHKLAKFRVRWFYRDGGAFVEHPDDTHLFQVIARDPVEELLAWVNEHSNDPNYQTIELDGQVIRNGYTEPEKSWERIKDWVDWNGKSVGDAGCFHGYFCFKAEEAGADAVCGYDKGGWPVDVSRRLAELKSSWCQFVQQDLSRGPATEHDVWLVLNSLHHIVRGRGDDGLVCFLQAVYKQSREAIFEINPDSEEVVLGHATVNGFSLVHDAESHRVTAKGTRRVLHVARDE